MTEGAVSGSYEVLFSDEIHLGMDMQELAAICSEEEPWEEITHGKSFIADTFADPDTAVALFIGHQATMAPS
jgi:hypothetical protein